MSHSASTGLALKPAGAGRERRSRPSFNQTSHAWQRWHLPLIPALGKQGQVGIYEFEAILVYIKSSRIARAIKKKGLKRDWN